MIFSTTRSAAAERARARDFISSLKWPRWPVLPMKRPRPGEMPEFGFLYADNARDEDTVIVYVTDTYTWRESTPDERAAIKRLTYPTVDALLDDGWVVD